MLSEPLPIFDPRRNFLLQGFAGRAATTTIHDAMTLVTGSGDIYDLRLLDHATVVSGNETAATVLIDIGGDKKIDGGSDWPHLCFRDARFTVTGTECRVETQLTATANAGGARLPVESPAGFASAFDFAFDIKAVASLNAGSGLTVAVQTLRRPLRTFGKPTALPRVADYAGADAGSTSYRI